LGPAQQDLDRAIDLRPDPIAFRHRGLLRLTQGDAGAALEDLDRAVRRDPWNQAMRVLRARAYLAAGAPSAAAADLTEALRLDPRNADLWRARAQVRLRQRDWAGAEEDLDQALRLEPESAAALEGRGDARLGLGRPDTAAADYRLAREHGADGSRIAAKLARLRERSDISRLTP
jgi:Tfp pilus assembly protein PilF